MKVFHVERINKALIFKGLLLFLCMNLFSACITPRHTVQINDYILLPNGKEILGKEKGLTAFVFENNPRKIPFHQFVGDKYNLPNYTDIEYWVTLDNMRFKVFVYENAEINKYFNTSEFMISNIEPDMNIIGSKAPFIALSVINTYNEDCLDEKSLFRNITLKYLKQLKDEYIN